MYRTSSIAGRAALRRMPQRLPRNVKAIMPHHRAFHGDGSVPQYSFTPAEEVLLDSTAWFVAFAMCWSPAHEFDDLDHHNLDDMQDQATNATSTRSSQGKREREKNTKDRKQPKKDDGRSHPDPSI